MGPVAAVHDDQPLRIHPQLGQRPAAQRRRRVEQHDAARRRRLGRGDAGQRRRQQPHLAHAGVRQQQFGQRLARPAAAGQLGIEHGETAAHGGLARAAQLVGAPQRGMQGFRGRQQGGCGQRVHPITVRLYSYFGKHCPATDPAK